MSKQAAITIVGLGPGAFGQLSIAAWEALQQAETLYLRTEIHPTVPELVRRGIVFRSYDHLYDQAETFDDVYRTIAAELVAAAQVAPVTYAVPGHPLVGETSVRLLLEGAQAAGLSVRLVPSMSALDAIYAAARVDPAEGLQIFDALSFTPDALAPGRPALFLQLYSKMAASELKIRLLDVLDPDTPVLLIRAAGTGPDERLITCPLHELDRQDCIDHLTSLYIAGGARQESCARPTQAEHPLDPLVNVMQQLRSENGCPWDRKQTHASLQRYLIEEAYEVIDAIDDGDWDALCEELGDVLLQVVFHAQLGAEAGTFTIDDVIQAITSKMIRRHPHVFADVEANDVSDVLRNWEAIKKEEKAHQGQPEASVLSGVPRHLPALMQAEEVQKKAAKVGFEWDDVDGALGKVAEEVAELRQAIATGTQPEQTAELGDVLFALVNVARYLNVDAEASLRATTAKFQRRFRHIEKMAAQENRTLADMTLAEMDRYWDEAKELERSRTR